MKNNTTINLTNDANYNMHTFHWDLDEITQYFKKKYRNKSILILNADQNKLFFKVDSKYFTMDSQSNIEELAEIKDMPNFHDSHVMLTDEAIFGIQYFGWDLDEIKNDFNKRYTNKLVVITDADLHRVFYTVDDNNYEMDVDGDIEEV